MSAFVVSKAHIDYLVDAARIASRRYGIRFGDQTIDNTNREGFNAIGRALWAENIASVLYAYPNDTIDTMPGLIGLDGETVALYAAAPVMQPWNPIAALKALDCYEYQSCAHPGWQESNVRAFCDTLRGHLIRLLPGYDDAPWGIVADTRILAAA